MRQRRELIPELHDTLKITKLPHSLMKGGKPYPLPLIPATRTWEGIANHHVPENHLGCPFDRDTFILNFADNQAASFSRYLGEKRKRITSNKFPNRPYIYKLWNPGVIDSKEDLRLEKNHEIKELLEFLNKDPDFQEFEKEKDGKYWRICHRRPEDIHWWRNITSLYSHMVITGKLYRLIQQSRINQLKPEELKEIDENKKNKTKLRRIISRLTREKEKNWQVYLAHLRLTFHQQPFRVRDFHIFDKLREAIKKIMEDFPDNVLMTFDDQIIMLYDQPEFVEEKILPLTPNFLVTELSCRRSFAEMDGKPDPKAVCGGEQVKKHYPYLPPTIEPPICEICQMAHADRVWPDDYVKDHAEVAEDRREDLCSHCFELRREKSPLKKLEAWSGQSKEGKEEPSKSRNETSEALVAWVRHSLDYEALLAALQELHWQYLQPANDMWDGELKIEKKDAAVKFSLLQEFAQEYELMVKKFNELLQTRFGADNFEPVNDHLACLRLSRRRQAMDILEQYYYALEMNMPKLRDLKDSPFFLGIALCPAKFPFFQAWRELNKLPKDRRQVEVSLIGHGSLVTDMKNLDLLLAAAEPPYSKTALYNLAEVARMSESLAQLKFGDHRDKQSQTYKKIRELVKPLGLDFRSILTLAHLLED